MNMEGVCKLHETGEGQSNRGVSISLDSSSLQGKRGERQVRQPYCLLRIKEKVFGLMQPEGVRDLEVEIIREKQNRFSRGRGYVEQTF